MDQAVEEIQLRASQSDHGAAVCCVSALSLLPMSRPMLMLLWILRTSMSPRRHMPSCCSGGGASHAREMNVLICSCSCPLTPVLLLLTVVIHVCSDPFLVRDVADCCAAAVCSCRCCSLGVAHPFFCATSVGCCSSKFARILGSVMLMLLLILELLCLLV